MPLVMKLIERICLKIMIDFIDAGNELLPIGRFNFLPITAYEYLLYLLCHVASVGRAVPAISSYSL